MVRDYLQAKSKVRQLTPDHGCRRNRHQKEENDPEDEDELILEEEEDKSSFIEF